MENNYFNSSALQQGQYNREQELLILTFRGNRNYAYNGVNQAVWEELIRAESAGTYYNNFIRGQVPCTPIQ